MTQYDAPTETEVRVRNVRQRSGEFVETAVELAGGFARLGISLAMLPFGLLPPEARTHTRNAVKELSYAFVRLPRDFVDIAGGKIEEWADHGEKPVTSVAPHDEVEIIK